MCVVRSNVDSDTETSAVCVWKRFGVEHSTIDNIIERGTSVVCARQENRRCTLISFCDYHQTDFISQLWAIVRPHLAASVRFHCKCAHFIIASDRSEAVIRDRKSFALSIWMSARSVCAVQICVYVLWCEFLYINGVYEALFRNLWWFECANGGRVYNRKTTSRASQLSPKNANIQKFHCVRVRVFGLYYNVFVRHHFCVLVGTLCDSILSCFYLNYV